MKTDFFFSLIIFAVALYLGKQWLGDLRGEKTGLRAFPGAVPASPFLIMAAIAGALVILAIETIGEYRLGTSATQSNITGSFLLVMVAAGFLEELIFRGYLVIENRGRIILWSGILAVSVLFTLGHAQYWLLWGESSPTGDLSLNFTTGSLWTLLILFVNSLWFYTVRFNQFNPARSLLPCIAAHISSNLGVFVIKLLQGHVAGII